MTLVLWEGAEFYAPSQETCLYAAKHISYGKIGKCSLIASVHNSKPKYGGLSYYAHFFSQRT